VRGWSAAAWPRQRVRGTKDLSLDDDGEYMCRLVAASERVRFVPQAACYYRIGNAGSLSAQKSERALRSGVESLHLCIDRLLQLEDSERTRRACLRLLQDNVTHFYPDHAELLERCRSLAAALGGELLPPHERVHFRLFRRVFGWHNAKRMRQSLHNARLHLRRTLEGWPEMHRRAH
jgi:hypothetical protein